MSENNNDEDCDPHDYRGKLCEHVIEHSHRGGILVVTVFRQVDSGHDPEWYADEASETNQDQCALYRRTDAASRLAYHASGLSDELNTELRCSSRNDFEENAHQRKNSDDDAS